MEQLEFEIFMKLRELMEYPEVDYVRDSVDALHQALSMRLANRYVEEHGYDKKIRSERKVEEL